MRAEEVDEVELLTYRSVVSSIPRGWVESKQVQVCEFGEVKTGEEGLEALFDSDSAHGGVVLECEFQALEFWCG